MDPADRAPSIMQGLHEAASQPGGTSADVSRAGTRAVPGLRQDGHRRARRPAATSPGTCAYACEGTRAQPIVVAVTVEDGGFGAETAAPVARLMLAQVVRRQGKVRRRRAHDLLSRAARHRPRRTATRRRAPRPPRAALPFDPVLVPRRARRSRRLAGDDRRRDRGRHRRATPTTTSAPGRSSSRVGAMLAISSARGLRAAARAQERRLRAADRVDPGGAAARHGRRAARGAPSASVLLVPGLRARQGPARGRRCRRSSSTASRRLRERDTTARMMLPR